MTDPPQLNMPFLHSFAHGEAPGDQTPFEGVHRLIPGRTLVLEACGKVHLRSWLNRETHGQLVDDANFRRQFDEVVAALAADVGVISLSMSGGLDSTFVAASLAAVTDDDALIHAFVHRPMPSARISPPPGWVTDDWPWAEAVAAHLGGRLVLHEIRNDDGVLPIDGAADFAERCWWPAWNPGNMVWRSAIHRRSRDIGADRVFTGATGNFTFSQPLDGPATTGRELSARWSLAGTIDRARLRLKVAKASSDAGPLQWLDRWQSDRSQPDPDVEFELRVAGGARSHPAALAPGIPGHLVSLDPFAARWMLQHAINRGRSGWPVGAIGREFARRVSADRLPAAVSRRTSRGLQAADVWWAMRGHRDRYLDEVALTAHTTGVSEWIDIAHLRSRVANWPWGQDVGPPPADLRAVNRIMTLSHYIRRFGFSKPKV